MITKFIVMKNCTLHEARLYKGEVWVLTDRRNEHNGPDNIYRALHDMGAGSYMFRKRHLQQAEKDKLLKILATTTSEVDS
jgi:hypothetical protein